MASPEPLASQEAFLVGLDLLVQRLANDAAEMYRTGHIDRDAFHDLITNYTGLRSDIRFRRRDLKKNELHPDR
jgi:hypothetical protein